MCPELYRGNRLIADVPDRTGLYTTLDGKPLYVNMDGIHPGNTVQTIVVQTEEIVGRPGSRAENGRREIQLSEIGTGAQQLSGYRDNPMLRIVLKDRPIRRASRKKYGLKLDGLSLEGATSNYLSPHPKWQQGHGRR